MGTTKQSHQPSLMHNKTPNRSWFISDFRLQLLSKNVKKNPMLVPPYGKIKSFWIAPTNTLICFCFYNTIFQYLYSVKMIKCLDYFDDALGESFLVV